MGAEALGIHVITPRLDPAVEPVQLDRLDPWWREVAPGDPRRAPRRSRALGLIALALGLREVAKTLDEGAPTRAAGYMLSTRREAVDGRRAYGCRACPATAIVSAQCVRGSSVLARRFQY
ncbi:MAG: hypothetical protein BGO98_37320 [Myxococcales bacterium 68-20]|nr:MAG: hypothetical protein BGO98_37320 [Myxococcales bacterium 68-20]